eukprot:819896-Pelagomonas_calceolata.AAC.1
MDSINHVVLRCPNPTMSGMRTNRHHVGLSFCVKALSKGRFNSSLIGMDACRTPGSGDTSPRKHLTSHSRL